MLTGNREHRVAGRGGNGHIHAGQLPKALPLLTWANTHTRSRLGDIIATITSIVILSTQNGCLTCPESRRSRSRILTFKCCRHCSQLTVRAEPHPSITESSELSAAGSWRRPIKISARNNNNKTTKQKWLGKAMQNICHGVKFLAYT